MSLFLSASTLKALPRQAYPQMRIIYIMLNVIFGHTVVHSQIEARTPLRTIAAQGPLSRPAGIG